MEHLRTPYVRVSSESDANAALDDYWETGDLKYADADLEDELDLVRQIGSYFEAALESQPRSFKDLLQVAHWGCLTTRVLSSEKEKVSDLEEEVRKVIWEFRDADVKVSI